MYPLLIKSLWFRYIYDKHSFLHDFLSFEHVRLNMFLFFYESFHFILCGSKGFHVLNWIHVFLRKFELFLGQWRSRNEFVSRNDKIWPSNRVKRARRRRNQTKEGIGDCREDRRLPIQPSNCPSSLYKLGDRRRSLTIAQ